VPLSGRVTSIVEEAHDREVEVKIGSTVPDFLLTCVDGRQHRLSDFRGKKVMVCFYRYSNCPACAYTISKLVGRYKTLAWASKLMVITVFRTDIEQLRKGLADTNAPIRRLSGIDINAYPFTALADPDGAAASTFKVDKKEALKINTFLKAMVAPSVFREVYLSGVKGGDTLLPSEFLIDENGVLVDVMRARKKRESMTMDRITSFLLLGQKHPSTINTRNTIG